MSAGVNAGVGGPMHGHHGHARSHGGRFSTFESPFYDAPVYCPPPGYPQPYGCVPSATVAGPLISCVVPPELRAQVGSPFGDVLPKTTIDVMQLQSKYDADFDAVSAAVAECAAAKMQGPSSGWLPAQMQADFTSFYLGWKSYVSDPNKGGITGIADDNYQLGLSMIQELNSWRDLFAQAGCDTFLKTIPKIDPPPQPNPSPLGSFTWPLAIGAVALAAALIFRR
jgi:hypothetical protein